MSGLQASYNSDTKKAVSFTVDNFTIDAGTMGGLPYWIFDNPTNDAEFTIPDGIIPATGSVVLEADPDQTQSSTFTIYWGVGSHHQHHKEYAGTTAGGALTIDWQTPAVIFSEAYLPDGVWDIEDKSGHLPLSGDPGPFNDPDKPDIIDAVKEFSAYYTGFLEANRNIEAPDGPMPEGSMFVDILVIKAVNGLTYARINFATPSFALPAGQIQQVCRFGIVNGDLSGEGFFKMRSDHAMAFNTYIETLAETPNAAIAVVAYAPQTTQHVDETVTKTTDSGWNISGSVDAPSGGGSSGGDGGGGGDAEELEALAL